MYILRTTLRDMNIENRDAKLQITNKGEKEPKSWGYADVIDELRKSAGDVFDESTLKTKAAMISSAGDHQIEWLTALIEAEGKRSPIP